jgi:hypothetical protein
VDAETKREAVLARMSSAFTRKDHGEVVSAMTPEIEIVVPGNSSFAGTYRGPDEAHGWLLAMRRVFIPAEQPTEFSHSGDDMVIRQVAWVGEEEYANVFRLTFDGALVSRIAWEPDDMEEFDELLESYSHQLAR